MYSNLLAINFDSLIHSDLFGLAIALICGYIVFKLGKKLVKAAIIGGAIYLILSGRLMDIAIRIFS